MVLHVAVIVITDPIGLIFMFSRFGNIGQWSVVKLLLIYSMAVTSFGIAETLFRGFDSFPWRMIKSGDFDRVLLRPRSLIVQIAGSVFHIHRLSRVFCGLGAIIWCLSRLHVEASLLNIIVILFGLAGGFFTYAGVFLVTSGIAFFTIQGLDWIFIFTNASYQVTRCPMDHMPRLLKNVFTFLMPMLVISYYPASAACGWGDGYLKGFLALPAGLAFIMLSVLVWRFGVRHYKSTGC